MNTLNDDNDLDKIVCVVGMGAVLPGAKDVSDFWENIRLEKKKFAPISENRWNRGATYHPNRNEQDKTYTLNAAEVSEEILSYIADKNRLNRDEFANLEIMAIEAVEQALLNVNFSQDEFKRSMVLGLINPDVPFFQHHFVSMRDDLIQELFRQFPNLIDNKEVQKSVNKVLDEVYKDTIYAPIEGIKQSLTSVIRTKILQTLARRFNFSQENFFVDSACASSLTAIEISVQKLLLKETDLVITGGLEDNLSPPSFVVFSKVKALAEDYCLPFERASEGLTQGEGVAIFALQRLSDALKFKNRIYGIISGMGAASDGKSTSLFQPSIAGQLRAYDQAYKFSTSNRVDYLESHATGTPIGDSVELISLTTFFKELKIPIGSVKALVGHTKATAGAASLLKALLIIQNRIIPPSSYIKDVNHPTKLDPLFINKDLMVLDKRPTPLRVGISSFGFGGINYHIVVDEFKEKAEYPVFPIHINKKIVVVSEHEILMDRLESESLTKLYTQYKILPSTKSKIDKTQILAVLLVNDLISKMGITLEQLDKNKVAVISSSTSGLDKIVEVGKRISLSSCVTYLERKDSLSEIEKKIKIAAIKLKETFSSITEDSGHGILNNVIAGRICNTFDFKGKNFNVDLDLSSFLCAVSVAKRELYFNPDQMIIIVGIDEEVDIENKKLDRKGARGIILTTHEFALEYELPILKTVGKVSHYGH